MGKKDRQSMEELWSKRFDEEAEETDEQPLSRKAKREREKSISPILTVTVIFMVLLIILPTSAYIWWSSRDGMSEEPSGPAVEQVADNNESEETEEPIEEEPGDPEDEGSEETGAGEGNLDENTENEEEMSESVTENDTESNEPVVSENTSSDSETEMSGADDPQNQETETDPNDTQSTDATSVTEEDQPTETAPPQSADYYTVKAGDNMYRIALNHGMTTEELMQLNNIQDETVYVGQELRVE